MSSLYSPFQLKIRAILRAARKARGLTQTDVGEALGLKQSAMSNIEKGQRYLDVDELLDWAALLGQDPWKVVNQASREAPPKLPEPLKPRSKSEGKRRARPRAKAK